MVDEMRSGATASVQPRHLSDGLLDIPTSEEISHLALTNTVDMANLRSHLRYHQVDDLDHTLHHKGLPLCVIQLHTSESESGR